MPETVDFGPWPKHRHKIMAPIDNDGLWNAKFDKRGVDVKRKLQIPSMTVRELRSYEEHMDTLRYQEDVLDTAYEEGRAEGLTKEARELAEGRAEGIVQVARNLISLGMDNVTIRNATGLSDREVEAIRNEAL